jgi:hypothetical protein
MKRLYLRTIALAFGLVAALVANSESHGQLLPEPSPEPTVDESYLEEPRTTEPGQLPAPEDAPQLTGPALTTSSPAYLGVTFDPSFRNAAVVRSVHPGSPAEQAGLQSGDIIEALNGLTISSNQDVIDIVSTLRAGDVVNIDYSRRLIARTQAALGRPTTEQRSAGYPPQSDADGYNAQSLAPPAAQEQLPTPPALRGPDLQPMRQPQQFNNPNRGNPLQNRSNNRPPNNGRNNPAAESDRDSDDDDRGGRFRGFFGRRRS